MGKFWLVLALTVLLRGGGEGPVGVWQTRLELAPAINAALDGRGLGEYLAVESCPLTMVLTLRGDGTYALCGDEAAFAVTLAEVREDLADGLTAYTQAKLAENGVEMEASAVFDAMGTTPAEMLEEALRVENFTALSSGAEEGRFAALGGKLFFSPHGETAINWQSWEEFSLKGEKLVLNGAVGTPHAAFAPEEYPLIFQKAG